MKTTRNRAPMPGRQNGATLMISLIMLLMITLFAIAAFKIGKANMQIVGNAQQHSQTMAAAQLAIEQVMSSSKFAETPANAIGQPCAPGGVPSPNTVCIDFNSDGLTKVTAVVAPTCVKTQIVPNTSLVMTNPEDAGCSLGANQTFGIAGGSNNNSLCADAVWNIQAVANDSLSSASSTIDQGISLRQPSTTVCP